jgi:(p)ppGpp synthase/HD superfamily hydrolase
VTETASDPPAAPDYIARSRLLGAAYEVASDVHAGTLGSGRVSLRHPVAVATLLHDAGYPEHVVAAALLHDVAEDGGPAPHAMEPRFGPQVADLVARLTEDDSIESYPRRKAALRSQAVGDGPEAAAIFAADKLASARSALRRDGAPPARKLEHYERSLWLLKARYPELPFLAELEADLTRLRARPRETARSGGGAPAARSVS